VPGDPRELPPLPDIRLEIIEDRTPGASASGGFLNIRRLTLVARYPDGTSSEAFSYDTGSRQALDAVVIVAHAKRGSETLVYLRSAVRPPLALREVPPFADPGMWECVAGMIDPGEEPRGAAVRELEEELGAKVSPEAMRELGPWAYPAPGMIGERHVFFHVEVDPSALSVPGEDGSPLERGARLIALPLQEALAHARAGHLRDSKTELALRRFAEIE
jgi:ADP-ribose pyrophosphatase